MSNKKINPNFGSSSHPENPGQTQGEGAVAKDAIFAMYKLYLAHILHEIRNPLGCIKGFITTLLREDIAWTPEKQTEFLQIIDTEADQILAMIEELSDTSQIVFSPYLSDPQVINPAILFSNLAETEQMSHPNHHIEFSIGQDLPSIESNPKHLSQALDYLIRYAINNATNSNISVRINGEADGILIVISDHKPAPIDLTHSDMTSNVNYDIDTNNTSSIVDLFVSEQIILAHHGRISLHTNENGIAIFIFIPGKSNK